MTSVDVSNLHTNWDRWSPEETQKLKAMRLLLKDKLENRRQLPDVVGDRRLLRFLRGHGNDVTKACKMFTDFLQWRDDNLVDEVRDDILFGGKSSPMEFPHGQKILELVPQIVIAHNLYDKTEHPISLELFGFSPDVVLKSVKKEEYITFMIYMLEYKVLVLEQLSHQKELDILSYDNFEKINDNHIHLDENISHISTIPMSKSQNSASPYGVILSCLSIRDFKGFGMSNLGSDGQTVMKWALEIAMSNYPELQYRCHMINVPWFFSTIWFVIKPLLDANIISKLIISNANDSMSNLTKDVNLQNIPARVGGLNDEYNTPFTFDLSKNGPFYYDDFPYINSSSIMDTINLTRRLSSRISLSAASGEMNTRAILPLIHNHNVNKSKSASFSIIRRSTSDGVHLNNEKYIIPENNDEINNNNDMNNNINNNCEQNEDENISVLTNTTITQNQFFENNDSNNNLNNPKRKRITMKNIYRLFGINNKNNIKTSLDRHQSTLSASEISNNYEPPMVRKKFNSNIENQLFGADNISEDSKNNDVENYISNNNNEIKTEIMEEVQNNSDIIQINDTAFDENNLLAASDFDNGSYTQLMVNYQASIIPKTYDENRIIIDNIQTNPISNVAGDDELLNNIQSIESNNNNNNYYYYNNNNNNIDTIATDTLSPIIMPAEPQQGENIQSYLQRRTPATTPRTSITSADYRLHTRVDPREKNCFVFCGISTENWLCIFD
eukprot:gene7109-9701_t